MKRIIVKTLKIAGIAGGVTVALLTVAAFVLNSSSFQQRLKERATEMLSDRLETSVRIDSVSVSVFKGAVGLYGVEIDDREQRKMLQVSQLEANVRVMALLSHSIVIEQADLLGFNALLLKPKDGEANYQFLIDAFKKDKKDQNGKDKKDKKKKGGKLSFDIDQVTLQDISVSYNEQLFSLHHAAYNKKLLGGQQLTVSQLEASWVSQTKKGPVNNSASIARLTGKMDDQEKVVSIERLNWKTDNKQPRKNVGKPKKGYFDVGHLDITADLRIDIDSLGKEGVAGRLTRCVAIDSLTGFDIRDLHASFVADKEKVRLRDIRLQQRDTRLDIGHAELTLPSKKAGRKLSYTTDTIRGRVLLRDIARPFTQVLGKFSVPLNLSVTMSGSDSTIAFRNILVTTDDKKLTINATGDIKNLKDKEKLDVRFHVSKMTAKGNITETIINQFTVKKLMMKQLRNLGNITYNGQFAVLWKREMFQGTLGTAAGQLGFQFSLDELNKYITGTASSKAFNLGKAMDIKGIGDIEAHADFKIDFSKPRTAMMRRQKGGKLPIGTVNATVDDCSYKGIHVRHIKANIESDGAEAKGDIRQYGNYRDLYCSFSFTNTDEMHKMKITHPGIKFHKMSDEDRQAKKERKQQKKIAKEKAKAEKDAQEAKDEKEGKKKKKKFLGLF